MWEVGHPFLERPFSVGTKLIIDVHRSHMDRGKYQLEVRVCKDYVNTLGTAAINFVTLQVLHLGLITVFIFH